MDQNQGNMNGGTNPDPTTPQPDQNQPDANQEGAMSSEEMQDSSMQTDQAQMGMENNNLEQPAAEQNMQATESTDTTPMDVTSGQDTMAEDAGVNQNSGTGEMTTESGMVNDAAAVNVPEAGTPVDQNNGMTEVPAQLTESDNMQSVAAQDNMPVEEAASPQADQTQMDNQQMGDTGAVDPSVTPEGTPNSPEGTETPEVEVKHHGHGALVKILLILVILGVVGLIALFVVVAMDDSSSDNSTNNNVVIIDNDTNNTIPSYTTDDIDDTIEDIDSQVNDLDGEDFNDDVDVEL